MHLQDKEDDELEEVVEWITTLTDEILDLVHKTLLHSKTERLYIKVVLNLIGKYLRTIVSIFHNNLELVD